MCNNLTSGSMFILYSADASVRLVGITGHTRGPAGRLEVLYNSQWSTVRSGGNYDQVARTVCQQLDYSNYLYYGSSRDLG